MARKSEDQKREIPMAKLERERLAKLERERREFPMSEGQSQEVPRNEARNNKRRFLSFLPIENVGRPSLISPEIVVFRADPSVQDGVSITSYGQGQLSGVMYTVPAHGEITIDFTINMLCVTPQDVINLNNLVKGLLDASHYHRFEETEQTNVSGGLGFMGFWSGGISASYSDVKHTLDGWGLSEANQQTIVNNMMEIAQKVSTFHLTGTVHNRDFDYDVSGNIFGIVMDATIQQSDSHKQLRFLAPKAHMNTTDGDSLPVVGPLYGG